MNSDRGNFDPSSARELASLGSGGRGRAQVERLVAALIGALLLVTASCTSWRRTESPEDTVRQLKSNSEIRVMLLDGTTWKVKHPWLSGDTLYGRFDRGELAAFPQDQVAKVETRQFSLSRTAILVLGVGGLIAVSAALAAGDYSMCSWSSCPHVYSRDGGEWRFECGAFTGAVAPPLARADINELRHVQAKSGVIRLRIAGVPGETEYVDAVRLLAVDHAPGLSIAPDPTGLLHAVGRLVAPTAARDFGNREVGGLIRENDDLRWESRPTGRDASRSADIRDGIEVEFVRPREASQALLVVDAEWTAWADQVIRECIRLQGGDVGAWYSDLSTATESSRSFAASIKRETYLGVSVWDGARWAQGSLVPGSGIDHPKRQVLPIDLTGIPGDTIRVRLESAPLMWMLDRVAIAFGPEEELTRREIAVEAARDARGRDLVPILARADRRSHAMDAQDAVDLQFPAGPTPSGRERTYLIEATGWYRPHTAAFHGTTTALAESLVEKPGAMSRFSVALLNKALDSMAADGRP